MKRLFAIAFLTFIVTISSLQAQAPAVPAASPAASLYQVIGISEVTVKYARPAVKGRTIYGGLVPYGEVWRTGANTNTTITLTHEATIGGVKVAAGTYGLFTIPGTSEWTVILSKDNTNWGSGNYKKENDAARFTVKPEKVSNVELLTFNFDTVDSDKGYLTIAWADVKIGFDIVFESHKNVLDKLKADVSWATSFRGADYLLKSGKDHDLAMKYIDISIAIDENYNNLKVKAQLLAKAGKKADAIATMDKALGKAAGMKNPPFDLDAMKKLLEEWKK
ncbi:MAG: hypothetical protein HBSAPP04_10350 [Ignavibacteriaceae bacterium]|nr:MAG: DUF2911 domain-containing protein [Chlorobiota bacterium]GJQ32196.1 MAG: hypothetical protein HBSAPP04_10350 [Ignavibacteriaceae bacterium]